MPNLSVEKIAGALAVLGTTVVLAACGGESKPANAPVTSTETPAPSAATGDATKAADGHCGSGKEHKAGEASCSAAKGGADTSAASTAPASATPAVATPSAPATPAADAAKPADAAKKADPKKPAAPAAPAAGAAGKKTSGSASCGAGTCAAKK